jgi:hypothetical protein
MEQMFWSTKLKETKNYFIMISVREENKKKKMVWGHTRSINEEIIFTNQLLEKSKSADRRFRSALVLDVRAIALELLDEIEKQDLWTPDARKASVIVK